MGHFVSSSREKEKRYRSDSRGDEREGQGRKENEWKWSSIYILNRFLWSQTLRKNAYSNIQKISPPKSESFQIKKLAFFHISAQNIDCRYLLELPWWGGSNEYPQSMFLRRNKDKRPTGHNSLTWVNCQCRYADCMQHFSNTLMTRQWLKQFFKYLAYKVKMLKFSNVTHKTSHPQCLLLFCVFFMC